jgi:hypothetical protein
MTPAINEKRAPELLDNVYVSGVVQRSQHPAEASLRKTPAREAGRDQYQLVEIRGLRVPNSG